MRLILVGTASVLLLTGLANAEEPCPPLKIVSSIDLKMHKRGPVAVPISIGGQQTMFLLSTTTPQSAIAPGLAAKLDLPRRPSAITTVYAKGSFSDEVATAKDVVVGNVRYGTVLLRLLGKDPPPNAPQGVLGIDLLRNYDVELDFAASRMNLISREHCADKVVYWPSKTMAKIPMRVDDNNRMTFRMTLDGHDLEATIDIGSPRTTLPRALAHEVFDVDQNSPDTVPVGGNSEAYRHKFKSITVEGLAIADPEIVLVPDASDRIPGAVSRGRGHLLVADRVRKAAPLRLGMSTLRQLHIYIDFHNQALYFTPAAPDATGATEQPPAASESAGE